MAKLLHGASLTDRIAPRFIHCEPLRHGAGLIEGLLSGPEPRNYWTVAEHRGHSTPDEVH